MRWPFVSRLRYELLEERLKDRDARIAELVKVNQELVELSKQVRMMPDEEEKQPEPPKVSRKLGSVLRKEFADEARERLRKSGVAK